MEMDGLGDNWGVVGQWNANANDGMSDAANSLERWARNGPHYNSTDTWLSLLPQLPVLTVDRLFCHFCIDKDEYIIIS